MNFQESDHPLRGHAEALDHEAENDDPLYRKIFLRILPLLVICYTISYLDRVNVSFAKLQMASSLHFSDTVYGFGAGIFFIGYVAAEVPSNLLLHRFGARRWIARILVTWGVMSALMIFTSSPISFYVFRFLLGITEAGFLPGAIFYLMQWFPATRRARATSILYLGGPISGLIGGPVSGLILGRMHEAAGLQGWQWMFLLEAIPAVVMGVIVFFFLDDRISDAKWLSPAQKERLSANLAREDQAGEHISLRKVFTDKRVLLFGAVLFLLVTGQYGIYFWLPTMIKESGVRDPLTIGLMTALPYALAVVAVITVGRLADVWGDRRLYLLVASLIGAVSLLATMAGGANTTAVLAGLSIATACSMVMIPIFYTFPPAILRGKSAAAGIALINSMGVTAGFVAPYLIGFLRDATGSPASGMYFLAGCWTMAGLVGLKFHRIKPIASASDVH